MWLWDSPKLLTYDNGLLKSGAFVENGFYYVFLSQLVRPVLYLYKVSLPAQVLPIYIINLAT
jgi:hypothetical protein